MIYYIGAAVILEWSGIFCGMQDTEWWYGWYLWLAWRGVVVIESQPIFCRMILDPSGRCWFVKTLWLYWKKIDCNPRWFWKWCLADWAASHAAPQCFVTSVYLWSKVTTARPLWFDIIQIGWFWKKLQQYRGCIQILKQWEIRRWLDDVSDKLTTYATCSINERLNLWN